jgi:hypothetical protein
MSRVAEMIDAHPHDLSAVDRAVLVECVEACFDCGQVCTACADACLSEEGVAELRRCIRTDLDCAEFCLATGKLLSRHTGYDPGLVRAALTTCLEACRVCAAECEQHAGMHEHCRICAEACRRCERACQALLGALGLG